MKRRLHIINLIENKIIPHFTERKKTISRDIYIADQDSQNIMDKDVDIIILGLVDICENILKLNKRQIPAHYKDRILACHEFLGQVVFSVAPLTKNRNEVVHKYLEQNWKNIVTVWSKLENIKAFLTSAQSYVLSHTQTSEPGSSPCP